MSEMEALKKEMEACIKDITKEVEILNKRAIEGENKNKELLNTIKNIDEKVGKINTFVYGNGNEDQCLVAKVAEFYKDLKNTRNSIRLLWPIVVAELGIIIAFIPIILSQI